MDSIAPGRYFVRVTGSLFCIHDNANPCTTSFVMPDIGNNFVIQFDGGHINRNYFQPFEFEFEFGCSTEIIPHKHRLKKMEYESLYDFKIPIHYKEIYTVGAWDIPINEPVKTEQITEELAKIVKEFAHELEKKVLVEA